MSNNFVCTHCGTRHNFHPGRCPHCHENTIIFDGLGDRQKAEQEERARRARAEEQQRRENEAAEASRARNKAAEKTSAQSGARSTDTTKDANDSDFSGKLAVIGFFVAGLWTYAKTENNLIAAGLVGLLAAFIVGKFYQAIIGFSVVGLLIYFFLV
jgi:predicted  nucleic acid-binding Zn-ribbon protein